MGVATDIVLFFHQLKGNQEGRIIPPTLNDFLRQHKQYKDFDNKLNELAAICKTLENEGLLFHAGFGNGPPPICNRYYSVSINDELAGYGACDFIAFGFAFIRKYFTSSVRAVLVEKADGSEDIGTGFIINRKRIVTARHCIESMNRIVIDGCSPDAQLMSIHCPPDEVVDLAVLTYDRDPFPEIPNFLLSSAQVLDDVMTMGFPPIPGFDLVQVAETAKLAATGSLKATAGTIVGRSDSYLGKQDYLLVSARVKGGNSGGPIINKIGTVVGIVTDLPGDSASPDPLGYGVATPSEVLEEMLKAIDSGEEKGASRLEFELVEGGVRTRGNR